MTEGDREGGYVETYTGGRFYPFDPRPSEVRLIDIAQGLAHTCRFGGQCRYFYSVALHSLHVADELDAAGHDPRVQCYGLFHDAGEAYLADVPRPIKASFDGFEEVESRILDAVWAAFGLPEPAASEWEAVAAADDRLLAYEAAELLSDGGWAADPPDRDYDLRAGSIEAVRDRFVERAGALLDRA